LRRAVDRVVPFAGDGVCLDVVDGMISVRGFGEMGEAREDVKASTLGDHTSTRYQPRYVADAIRAFGDGRVTIQVQQGVRPTVFSGGRLQYLVVPLRTRA
jgi:DNA polymerase-3 subunit beta